MSETEKWALVIRRTQGDRPDHPIEPRTRLLTAIVPDGMPHYTLWKHDASQRS
jgi:hypothetical protein